MIFYHVIYKKYSKADVPNGIIYSHNGNFGKMEHDICENDHLFCREYSYVPQ